MSNLTIADLEDLNQKFMDRLDEIVEEMVAPMIGRQLKSVRAFKERSDGSYIDHEIVITVVGGFMNQDGVITLQGTYPHPHSGKPVETEISV